MRTTVPGVRTFVLICIILFSSAQSFSQSIVTGNGKVEIGLGLGPMFFVGDLGGNRGVGTLGLKDVNLPLTKFSKGIFLTILPAEWIGIRFALNQSMVDGYDSLIVNHGGDEMFRKVRNQDFRSNIMEAYGALEIYPTVPFEKYDGLKGKFRPYGIIGVGMFHFKPQGMYFPDPNSTSFTWVDLQPLRLEGQGMAEYPDRKQFSLTQMEIPMGFGFKYYVKENLSVGFEVLHRKTNTDYIDAVSTTYIDPNLFAKYLTPLQAAEANQIYNRQGFVPGQGSSTSRLPTDPQRGDSKRNDAFFSTILRLSWRLNDWNSPNGRALRQLKCPAYW